MVWTKIHKIETKNKWLRQLLLQPIRPPTYLGCLQKPKGKCADFNYWQCKKHLLLLNKHVANHKGGKGKSSVIYLI